MSDAKPSGGNIDRRVLFLNADDNVGVACTDLAAGTALGIDGNSVTLPGNVELGHKLARSALAEGDKIIKWGAEIGSVTQAVPVGGHVHLHNMKSDYIPTYTFEEGQRFVAGEE
ncbi:MAG: UxaA family hydrolase [Rhodospirillales bacterium]|jgi:altronate dehydratase small subunit|nr:UxaA family hydrolase [Rhodospirillales bacterium]